MVKKVEDAAQAVVGAVEQGLQPAPDAAEASAQADLGLAVQDDGASGVSVILSCVYAGHPDNPGPGDTVIVQPEEAERLVALGVAKLVAADTAHLTN